VHEEDVKAIGIATAPSGKKGGAGQPDWGEIFALLLAHTSMGYEEIKERTIPVIESILSRIGKHIEIKVGLPGMLSGKAIDATPVVPKTDGKPPKLSEFISFANAFNKN